MKYTDADAVRFAERFTGREGVHARMWCDGSGRVGYSPIQAPLDAEVARAHFDGRITAGSYLVRADNRTTHAVIDLDATAPALERAASDKGAADDLREATARTSQALREALESVGLVPLLVNSGHKGTHLWCFLDNPVSAGHARSVIRGVIGTVDIDPAVLRAEAFPKQARVREGGLGNLVKLPLGVHLRTGRRAEVLRADGKPSEDPLGQILEWPRTPLPEAHPTAPADPAEGPASQVQRLLQGCPMIRAVVEGAKRDRALDRDALLVLNHTVGHLAEGVEVLHDLYDAIPGLPDCARLGAPLRGHPMSCSKVRKRIPALVDEVPCSCVFADRSGEYPHPLRHLDETRDLKALFAKLAESRRQIRAIETEAATALGELAGHRLEFGEGAWRLAPDGSVQFVHGQE